MNRRFSWLRYLQTRFGKARKVEPIRRERRPMRVEELEDRVTPAIITWTSAASGSWQVPANWDLNRAPAVGDDVVIPDVGNNGADLIVNSNGTVAVNSLTAAENLTIAGGTFSVLQGPQVTGALTVSAGTMTTGAPLANIANVSVAGGATLAVNGVPMLGSGAQPASLKGLWHLDGTTTDSAGTHNPSSTSAVNYVTGVVAIGEKPGAGGFIDIPDTADLRLQRATLSAWVRPDGPGPNSGGMIIFGKQINRGSFPQTSYELGWDTNTNRFYFSVEAGGVASSHTYAYGQVYHVAATYDGSTITLYVNGVADGQVSYSGTIEFDGTPWTIGASGAFRPGYSRTFNGLIDEVALYNGALTAADVANMVSARSYTQTAGTTTVGGTIQASAVNVQGGSLTLGTTTTIPNAASLWRAEGNAADSVGTNTGTLTNGATFTAGKFGQAFNFDGTDDYVSVGNQLNMGASDFTLAAWIKGDPTMESWGRILDKGYLSGYAFGRQNNGSSVAFEFLGSSNSFATTSAVIDNTWHHVAVVKQGGVARIYADGRLENTGAVSAAAQNNSQPLWIGYNPGEGTRGHWKGQLDDIGVFTRALSAAEIAALAGGYPVGVSGTSILATTGTVAGPVTVSPGAMVSGAGTVGGSLTNAGTVAPGSSPGIITINGNYSQTGTLGIEIGGSNSAVPEFDQLIVNGAVSLAGALNVSFLNGFAPAGGTSFKVIDNDGTDAVTGTFTGRAEGSTFTVGGTRFRITYQGGSGNDVVLTALRQPVVWDGGAGTLNWSDALNWNSDAVPITGDDVTIPDLPGAPTITFNGNLVLTSLIAAESLTIVGGSLTVSQPAQINGLTQSGGVFVSAGPVTNSGDVTIGPGASVAITGVPTNGLVSLWHGEGNATDSADGNSGTPQGGTTFTPAKVGSGFTFDSDDDRVVIPHSTSLDVQATGFTAEFWMKGVKNQPQGLFDVLEKSHGFIDSTGWTFQGDSATGVLYFGIGLGGAGNSNFAAVAGPDVLDGNFHHVAGTWEGGVMRLYVDGVLRGTANVAAPVNNTRPLDIGFAYGGGTPQRFFRGQVDEVGIYNRALSPSEVQANAAAAAYTQSAGSTIVSGTLQASSVTVAAGSLVLASMTIPNAVGLWRGEGTPADTVGSNTGTPTNGATYAAGKIGQAFSFDGTNDYVQFGQKVVPTSGSYTVSLFARQAVVQGGIVELISQGVSGAGFFIGRNSDGTFRVSDSWVFTGVPYFADTAWHHVAVTVDAATNQSRLYVDGVLRATLNAAITTTTGGTNTRLGRQFDPFAEYFNGQIDEVGVFGRALSADEVAALSRATFTNVSGSTLTVPAGVISGAVAVSSGGTLNGSGTVAGPLTNSGTVSPGITTGIVTVNGAYSQGLTGTLNIDVQGPNGANPDYDQLVVNGTVTLAGALNLTVPAGYPPALGTSFVILNNDGTDAVTGTFAGLPSGAALTANGVSYTISYTGGTGNDVVLSVGSYTPVVGANSAAVSAIEGGSVTNSGTFGHLLGAATVTLTASVGTVTPNAGAGTWTWSLPVADGPLGPVPVTITARDVAGNTATAMFTYSVTNAAPTIADAAFLILDTSPNGAPVGTLHGSDVAADTLTYAIVGGTGATAFQINASTGAITVVDAGQLDYETAPSLTLLVRVSDEDGASSTATITVNLHTPPSAQGDAYTTGKNEVLTVAAPGVLANDSDPDGDPVAVLNPGTVTTAQGALLTLNANGGFVYNPNGQFAGLTFGQTASDSYTYTLTDGRGGTATATVQFTITNSQIELPDLTLTSSDISFSPVNPAAGAPVTLRAVIHNAGYLNAGPFDVEFRNFGTVIGTAHAVGLAAGGSTAVSIVTSFPDAGYRLIKVVADAGAAVTETQEGNNEAGLVLQIGTPATPSAVIHVAANAVGATPGQVVTSTGTGFYDFDTVPGVNDYPVQGGAVTVEILTTLGQVVSTFTGTHTTTGGALGQPIVAPTTAGNYLLRVTVTDSTASGSAVSPLTVVVPTVPPPPPPFVPPQQSDPPPQQPVSPGTIQLSPPPPYVPPYVGGAASTPTGSVSVTNNVFVYAEHVFFTDTNPDVGEDIFVFAYVSFSGTNDPVAPFDVTLNDIFPVAGSLQTFTMGSATANFPHGQADSPFVVVFPYRNTAAGAHILQIDTTPPAAKNATTLDDDATRLLQVGPPASTVELHNVATLLTDADGNGRVTPGDTLRYTIVATNTSSTPVTGASVFDQNSTTLTGVPFNIVGGGTASGGAVTWNLGTLAAHQTVTLAFDIPVTATDLVADVTLGNVAWLSTDQTPALDAVSRVIVYKNDPPVAVDDSAQVTEDGAVTIAPLANDSDRQNNIVTNATTNLSSPAAGALTNNGNGTFLYRPNGAFETLAAGETATVGFEYRVFDSFGVFDNGTVTVTITGVNDAPTVAANSGEVAVNEGSNALNGGLFADIDLSDLPTITASLGTVSQSASNVGTWSWSWDALDGPAGPTTVTITADDHHGGVATTTFTVIVANLAPTATFDGNSEAVYGDTAEFQLTDAVDASSVDFASLRYGFALSQAGLADYDAAGTDATYALNLPAGSYTIWARVIDKDGDYTDYHRALSVTPAPLTIAAVPNSKVYGQADPALTYAVAGLQYHDAVGSVLSGGLVRDPGENVGNYAIALGTLAANGNYTIAFTGATLTVTPATLAVAADAHAKMYGQADPALTYEVSNLQFDDEAADVLTGSLMRTAGENAGSYAIGLGTLAANANYTIDFNESSLTITPAILAVAADARTKVYGQSDPALTYAITGLQYDDKAADVLTGALTRADGETVGSYAIGMGTLAANDNYSIAFTDSSLTITPATLGISADHKTKVYGEDDPVLTYSVSGLQLSDTVGGVLTGGLTRADGENVGSYAIGMGTLAANGNYTIAFTGAALSVTPAPLTIVAGHQTKVYGQSDPALTYAVTGLQYEDAVADVLTGGLTRAVGETVGSYSISLGTLAANGNYTISYTGAALTITPATLTVAAENQSRVYGQADPAFTAAISGFVLGETAAVLSGVAALTTTATAASPVGAYPISAVVGTLAAANYTFVFAAGTLTVTPAALTLTADNQTKVYGAALPALTGTLVGVVNGDAITATYNTAATAASDVGSYTITATLNDPNGRLGNYVVSNTAGTLTVTKANQTITWGNPTDIVYGTPLGGAQMNASVSVPGTSPAGSLTYSTAAGTVLPAGAGQTLTVTAAATGNYNAASASVVLNVTPATLTVTAGNTSKVYGQANPVLTATISGFVNGETGSVVSGSPVLATTATIASPVGSYPITAAVGTVAAANYTFAFAPGTLTVSKASTATSASASAVTPLYGVDGVTLAAAVGVVAPGGGAPSGSVTFSDGSTVIGTATVVNGVASLALGSTTLAAGAHSITASFVGDDNFLASAAAASVIVLAPSAIQGLVYVDADDDGLVDFGETAVGGVTVTLTGTDDRGAAVSRSVQTDGQGVYVFTNLRPSNSAGYKIVETQPAGLADGRETLGKVGGVTVGSAAVNDTFSGVVLAQGGSYAQNYNFGERPTAGGAIQHGQTATIGFWQNKNGQALIKSLNGGSTATQLGNWLATNFPNMYGAAAGVNNLAGKTNAQVAAFYKALFANTSQSCGQGPPKMDAQVMATALAVYVTNQSLAGTTAAAYGFLVTATGVGARTFNVGCEGAAFGVANNSTVTVMNLLLAVNDRTRKGLLYDMNGNGQLSSSDVALRTMANEVFTAINEAGDI